MTDFPIKFLLVDDLDANLIALEALLRRDGLELLKARSATEALELLLVHEVALALLDVQMPGMDGFELAEMMRGTERTRGIPIIFVTAGAMDQQRRFRGYDAGAVDFIFKPIEPHILQSKASIFFELAQQREALRRQADEARAANRAKDEFLAALSHELRTPLTPVLMSAAALEHDHSLPQEVRDQASMMRRNVELEARLIDDLLDITRINRGKLAIHPEPADLHRILRETVEIVRSDFVGREPQLVFALDASQHHASVDPTRIRQVFWNLIKNAFKFTAPSGRITIGTQNDETGEITIRVTDTGVGISAEALPKIFKAFEQGDQTSQHRFGGLGLGLAISNAIISIHEGALQATSAGVGRGATFVVSLATVDSGHATAKAKASSTISSPSLNLLVVEDHNETNAILTRLLRRDGHTVTGVSSICDALTAFATSHFDAVISDLGLPDGSGLDLMEKLRQMRPVLGIALSGYGMEDDLEKTRKAGFQAHLVKPVEFEQLRRVLNASELRAARD